ncbi:ZIP family metal transporter [Clostridiisalibacter paucivorans]|uniref:ZIP family metal transporter n=1 Tax=Clostridiisalibacter paucivorans TaxID=408753 RepID=UPI0006861704|nr:ZIP family metal transporter [Clostridiisalibacter paucivorans]
MDQLVINTTISTLVGVIGTGIGGIISVLLVRPNKTLLDTLMGLTGGIMLSIVTFDLLPEAENIGGIYIEIMGITIGVVVVLFIESVLNFNTNSLYKHNNRFLKTGIIMGTGIAIHNFPEGLAIGAGLTFTIEMGIKVAILMAFHNIPEGMAMGTPLRISGFSKLKVFFFTLLAGIPTGIGAFIGTLLGNISDKFIAFCLSLAGGAMLYIIIDEIIPTSKDRKNNKLSSIGFLLGLMLGLIIIGNL